MRHIHTVYETDSCVYRTARPYGRVDVYSAAPHDRGRNIASQKCCLITLKIIRHIKLLNFECVDGLHSDYIID
jgi:hypothetical protein